MKQWNPDDARKLTIDSLKIVPSVRQWLSFQKLYPTDLLIVLHNSTARPFRSTYFFYSFRQAISTPGYAIAQAAGLEDVGILMNTRGWVIAVTRDWTRPRPVWSPTFSFVIRPETLLLTQHARDRLNQRFLSGQDVAFVIRHGDRRHQNNQVHYALLSGPRRVANGARWQRLSGVHVVVCPFTTEIITVWQDFRQASRRPRPTAGRLPARKPTTRPKHGPRSWRGWSLYQ